ncbi:hypothetical protein DC366_06230 [Pelagivirga sediminicola]|uniref:DUF3618 domain-containing protein n=1 Tax=Pelagivirga sediminicola TaxID=2170575 RepID=A0A2T7GA82_9RHOB|nr:DUF3618 domain-containing protein [Pelagivirga sediminicola]PVA11332.1 hypothetical protein DC366_06230 [Pelagivirga sediminicola]
MTNDTRSPEDIEREIERERAGLRDSIDGLQNRLSFDGMFQQFGDQVREHGGDFGRSVAQSARDNPVALALTGVGLAWLMFGNNRKASGYDDRYSAPRDRRDFDEDVPQYAARRGASYTGPKTAARQVGARQTADRPNPGQPAWARDWDRGELEGSHHGGPSLGARVSEASSHVGDHVRDAASGARDAVASSSSSAADAVSSGAGKAAGTVRDAVQGAADTASSAAQSVRDAAGNVWSSAAHHADAVQRRLSEGTEHLSEEARERIAAARARAMDARDAAARRLNRGADQVADFYEEHPLVVGALAFAVGAAVAGALPRTRLEDEYVGEYSDDLYDEAERIYHEEVEKAQRVAKAGIDEAKNVASDLQGDAADATDAAARKAKSAADRVAGAVKDKAEEENLGDVKKDS